MLRYTGHPFVDVGVATITSFSKEFDNSINSPHDIDWSHIDRFIEWMLPIYANQMMVNYVSGVLFFNFYPFQHSVYKPLAPDQRYEHRYEVLSNLFRFCKSSFEELRNQRKIVIGQSASGKIKKPIEIEITTMEDKCIFSGEQALFRISRSLLPMTLGENDINFVPEGKAKLPISGWCLLSLFAMPFGGLNNLGKMLIVHSSSLKSSDLIEHFARKNLIRNKQNFQMGSLENVPTYEFARTHLIEDLLEFQGVIHVNASLSAYLFSNSGNGPSMKIYHLPSNVVNFVSSAKRLYPYAWKQIIEKAFYMGNLINAERKTKTDKSTGNKTVSSQIHYYGGNYFYEDLFGLPQNAYQFLRRYLLRLPRAETKKNKFERKTDPRFKYSLIKEQDTISWGLTSLFLERILGMNEERIRTIRDVADQFADYIQAHRSKNKENFLVREFLNARRNLFDIRFVLIKYANKAREDAWGEKPLLPEDKFQEIFFEKQGNERLPQWRLAYDLFLIRVIEQLHKNRWADENPEAAEKIEEDLSKNLDQEYQDINNEIEFDEI